MRATALLAVAAIVVIATVPARAAQGGFTATLTAAQQEAAGVAALTDAERESLDALVAAEVALARQGDVAGFAGTFSSRRSEEERTAAGIGRLGVEQIAELDRLVAALIAAGPVQSRVPRRVQVSEGTHRDRLEVHGEISYTVGWASGGRSFQGGSMTTTLFDRETGSSISFTYGRYDGDLIGCRDWRYIDRPVADLSSRGRGQIRTSGVRR